MVDLDSNRATYQLTSAEEGVWFDLGVRGVPQRISWTPAGRRVAFLVWDKNGNGMIDDGSELFGTSTRKRDGTRAAHGFDALADLDGLTSAADRMISVADHAYWNLKFWIDSNHDGVSDPGELLTLPEAGVKQLSTQFERRVRRDEHGNVYKLEGFAVVSNSGRDDTRRMVDVFLVTAPAWPTRSCISRSKTFIQRRLAWRLPLRARGSSPGSGTCTTSCSARLPATNRTQCRLMAAIWDWTPTRFGTA
jgi:hypothetical protein